MTDLFNWGIPTFDDMTLFQDPLWLAPPFPPSIFSFFWGGCRRIQRSYRRLNKTLFHPSRPLLKFQSFLKPPRCWLTSLQETLAFYMREQLRGSRRSLLALINLLQSQPHLWCVPHNSYPQKISQSITTQPSPSPSLATTFPADWIRIPQRRYDYGRKQLDFNPSDPIYFSAKNKPGINLREALHKDCPRLNHRDDPILQGTSGVISCRLLVRSLHHFSFGTAELTQTQVPLVP